MDGFNELFEAPQKKKKKANYNSDLSFAVNRNISSVLVFQQFPVLGPTQQSFITGQKSHGCIWGLFFCCFVFVIELTSLFSVGLCLRPTERSPSTKFTSSILEPSTCKLIVHTQQLNWHAVWLVCFLAVMEPQTSPAPCTLEPHLHMKRCIQLQWTNSTWHARA